VALDVVVAELLARPEVPEQVAAAHQLRQVLVAGDECRALALLAHHRGQRPDQVVGLVLRVDEHRHAQVPAQLAAALELQHQVRRRPVAVGLVGRVDAAAVGVGAALVEGDGDVARAHALDQVTQEAREAEHRVRGVAVAVAHVRQHRVVRAEDVHRGVDEEDQGWVKPGCRNTPPP